MKDRQTTGNDGFFDCFAEMYQLMDLLLVEIQAYFFNVDVRLKCSAISQVKRYFLSIYFNGLVCL